MKNDELRSIYAIIKRDYDCYDGIGATSECIESFNDKEEAYAYIGKLDTSKYCGYDYEVVEIVNMIGKRIRYDS
jgi:hypothetical protein